MAASSRGSRARLRHDPSSGLSDAALLPLRAFAARRERVSKWFWNLIRSLEHGRPYQTAYPIAEEATALGLIRVADEVRDVYSAWLDHKCQREAETNARG